MSLERERRPYVGSPNNSSMPVVHSPLPAVHSPLPAAPAVAGTPHIAAPQPPRRRTRRPHQERRRRSTPAGVYLGTWRGSGLAADAANAVYGSQDRRGRVNRRVSKETARGEPVRGGQYNYRRTACKHEEVEYIPTLAAMSKEQVNHYIRTFLRLLLEAPPPPTTQVGSDAPN